MDEARADYAVPFEMEVDGEVFRVRRAESGGCHYDWLSGPNDGYGFSTSAPADRSLELHRRAIRSFLAAVDPATGYIEDD